MKMEKRDLVVIGGGPAGLASCISAFEQGIRDIVLIERDHVLGGILNQCIHNGFGLHRFKEELTGPEYAKKYEDFLRNTPVEVRTDTMVISLTEDKVVTAVSKNGMVQIQAKAIILAMGCRERPRGAIMTPGERVSGIYTAGTAQRLCNIDGYLVGKRVVILGSGDIGLIMARRMTLEGAKVLAVVEICPYSNGLVRNIHQCLDDFHIPLYLSYTITDIQCDKEHKRVNKVLISKVDEKKNPIAGTEIGFDCDTLLLSVGLIPENELSKKAGIELDKRTKGPVVFDNLETDKEGIFACGNVLQVHDLVDNVSLEAEKAGRNAALYIQNGERKEAIIEVLKGENISYCCPQFIRRNPQEDVSLFFRVLKPCKDVEISLSLDGEIILKRRFIQVLPSQMISLTVKKEKLSGGNFLSVFQEEKK